MSDEIRDISENSSDEDIRNSLHEIIKENGFLDHSYGEEYCLHCDYGKSRAEAANKEKGAGFVTLGGIDYHHYGKIDHPQLWSLVQGGASLFMEMTNFWDFHDRDCRRLHILNYLGLSDTQGRSLCDDRLGE